MLCAIDKCDFDSLSRVIRQSVRNSVAETEEDAQFLIADIEQSLRDWLASGANGYGQAYRCEEEVAGLIVIKDYWNLSHLFVSPRLQRQGIGTALLRAAVEACKDTSPRRKIQLNSSTNGAAFYEAAGFVRTGPGIARAGGCIPYEFAF